MSIVKYLNGLSQALSNRDELILTAISEKYDIPLEDLQKLSFEITEDPKNNKKSIKPQARQPKRKVGKEKKEREKSGYHSFCKEIRPEAQKLLKTSEDARKFKNRKGESIYIDPATFENGVPSFANTTQKCASMWWELTQEERNGWMLKAKTAVVEEEEEAQVEEEDNEDAPEEEDDDVEIIEGSEEEEEPTPNKAPKGKAPPKAVTPKGKAAPKSALPPKKGEGRVKNPAPTPTPKGKANTPLPKGKSKGQVTAGAKAGANKIQPKGKKGQ